MTPTRATEEVTLLLAELDRIRWREAEVTQRLAQLQRDSEPRTGPRPGWPIRRLDQGAALH
jgi:hypothetical protein